MLRALFIVTWMTTLIGAAMSQSNESPLIQAVSRGDTAAVASLLMDGVDIDKRNARGQTELLIATHGNHVDIARRLIEAGADVNAKDDMHDSAYLYAGARGHLEILKMTLRHGADLKSTNRYGGTALIPASERGHVDTVKALIEVGVNVDHVNNLGWTALLEAIMLGNGSSRYIEIVRLLVDAGADVNLADSDGLLPSQHARSRGFTEMVDILENAPQR